MIIELRVHRAGVNWEQIEPIRADIEGGARRSRQELNAFILARAIAKGEKQEVRWNFEGSPQGHYIGGF